MRAFLADTVYIASGANFTARNNVAKHQGGGYNYLDLVEDTNTVIESNTGGAVARAALCWRLLVS